MLTCFPPQISQIVLTLVRGYLYLLVARAMEVSVAQLSLLQHHTQLCQYEFSLDEILEPTFFFYFFFPSFWADGERTTITDLPPKLVAELIAVASVCVAVKAYVLPISSYSTCIVNV